MHVQQGAAGETREKDESFTGPGSAASHAVTLGRSSSTVGANVSSATGDFMSEMAHRLKERRAKAVSEDLFFSAPFVWHLSDNFRLFITLASADGNHVVLCHM